MILDDIKAKLTEIDPKVFYGMADDSEITDEWNYIVFMRKGVSFSDSKCSFTDRFTVAVIREDYIPEGMDKEIIEKLCSIDGVRVADPDFQYNYVQKPNTNTVVEILTMEFVRARKRVAV